MQSRCMESLKMIKTQNKAEQNQQSKAKSTVSKSLERSALTPSGCCCRHFGSEREWWACSVRRGAAAPGFCKGCCGSTAFPCDGKKNVGDDEPPGISGQLVNSQFETQWKLKERSIEENGAGCLCGLVSLYVLGEFEGETQVISLVIRMKEKKQKQKPFFKKRRMY